MRAAYQAAEEQDAPVPLELEMSWRVSDIGAAAVLGNEAAAYLIRRVTLSGAVYRAYKSRDAYRDEHGAANWVEWACKHPEQNRLLIKATIANE